VFILIRWFAALQFLRAGGLSLQACLGSSLARFGLFGQDLFLVLDGLHVVNGLDEHPLVLEFVTLGQSVQGVVNVLVDFLGVPHFFEQTTKDPGAPHPKHLDRQTSVGGTLALTVSGVSSLFLGFVPFVHASATVNDGGFLNNESVAVQPGNIATRVGEGNLVYFVGIQPDFAFSAFQDRRRETLLEFE